jgi:two-component sensor histidine kinase/PAS domain-containing protein
MLTPKLTAVRGEDMSEDRFVRSEAADSPQANRPCSAPAGIPPVEPARIEDAEGISTRLFFPHVATKVEPHLAALQKAMLNTTPDCVKVVSVEGTLLTMNRAGCLALKVPEESEFGMPWLPLLPEEVRPLGAKALHQAAAGQTARFLSRSAPPNGTIYWDNLLTPVVDTSGEVLSILCVSRDVTEKTVLEKQLKEAIDREKLRSLDMHHRVRNLFSLVSGLISLAEKESASAKAPEATTNILRKKLRALSGTLDIAFAQGKAEEGGETSVDLEPVVRAVLQPYGDHCTVLGRAASIRREAVTTYAIILNELATNSVKYGALSTDKGNVTLRWAVNEEMLNLMWIETEGPEIWVSPERLGFGTELVDRLVWFAGGTINRTWRTEGLVVDLHLPNSLHR